MEGPWEKAKVVNGFLAAMVIPLAVGYTGYVYSSAIKERELQGKFVELAVGILREPPDPNSGGEIRKWATTVIDRYSGVPLSEEVRKELIKRGIRPLLPSGTLPEHALPDHALPQGNRNL